MSDDKQSDEQAEATESFVSDWYEALNQPRPLLVVISGPSGVGKDVTIQLMKERDYPCHFVVTATTRPKRPNEVDGVDYHFLSEEAFQDLIARDELLERAVVYGQHKGIPKSGVREALASGKDVVMRIDVQGAATIREVVPQAVTVFITAESEEALIARLRKRGTEDDSQLKARIETARGELLRAKEFKYRVTNCECALNETVEQVIAIIRAEKARLDWQPVEL